MPIKSQYAIKVGGKIYVGRSYTNILTRRDVKFSGAVYGKINADGKFITAALQEEGHE